MLLTITADIDIDNSECVFEFCVADGNKENNKAIVMFNINK